MATKALPPAKINPTKLLGESSFATKKISVGALRDESITIPKRDLIIVKTQVIKIKDLIQSSTLLKSAEIERKRKESEKEKFGKEEEKLETKKEPGSKKLNVPGLPKLGFLDRLKNFIFNTLLGYFVYRLVPYIPQLVNFVKIAAPAFDFIIDMSGKLLNGMVSFIDAGYKAVDATRGLVGKTFGDDALKNFDKLTGEFEKFMNLAIIVGMASADFGKDRLGRKLAGKGTEAAAKKGAGTLARRGVSRVATRAGARISGKLGAKIGSKAFKAIPFLGAGLAIVEGIMRIKDGDYVGGLLSFGSAIPVAGWAFLALDIAREFMGGPEFDKSVGRAFGGKPGLTDKQVQKRTPSMSGPSFMQVAGGGPITRGGKIAGGVRRGVKKTKVTRGVKVEPPTLKPGAAVGGEKQIEKIFPETDKKDTVNPGGYIKKSYDTLGTAPFFGPLLAIATKVIAGEKPSAIDYKNAGQGLSGWLNNTFGNSTNGYAGGGEVGPSMFNEDMTNVIAKSIEDSISSKIDETIQDLMKNLMLKSSSSYTEKTPAELQGQPGQMAPGSVPGGQLTIEQLVGLAKGAGFSADEAVIMAAIAMGESGGNSTRTNFVPPDKSYGLWQINMIGSLGPARLKEFGLSSEDQLLDPVTNAKAAYAIRKSQGLSAWTVYKAGIYKNFLAQAQAAKGAPSLATSPVSGGSINSKSIVEYITGDPNTPVGRFDLKGHGTTGNYHDHIAFATIQDKENAKAALRAAGIQIGSEYRSGDRGYHGSNLAIDVPGNQWKGSGAIGQKEYNGSKRVREILGLAKGGLVRGMTHAVIGEKGPEFVLDSNTTTALENTFPGFLDALNKANYNNAIQVLRDYASYESGSEEQIVVQQPAPEIVYLPMPMPMGSGMGFGGGGSSPDSDYDMTYMNA
jgi:hypothetical protein